MTASERNSPVCKTFVFFLRIARRMASIAHFGSGIGIWKKMFKMLAPQVNNTTAGPCWQEKNKKKLHKLCLKLTYKKNHTESSVLSSELDTRGYPQVFLKTAFNYFKYFLIYLWLSKLKNWQSQWNFAPICRLAVASLCPLPSLT